MSLQRSRDALRFRWGQNLFHLAYTSCRAFTSTSTRGRQASRSTDPKEVQKFAALASEWWSPAGPFKALHELNNARVHFIKEVSRHALGHDACATAPLNGLKVLDVGCGGGILAEALARLGGQVTGIDVTSENIMVAREHMRRDAALTSNLRSVLIGIETSNLVTCSRVGQHNTFECIQVPGRKRGSTATTVPGSI